MRLGGIVYVKVKCPFVHGKIDVPILFSCSGEKAGKDAFRMRDFLPVEVVKVVKKVGNFLIKFAGRELKRAYVTDILGENEIVSTLSGEVVEEKRLFDRFSFCLGESNEFLIRDMNLKSFLVNVSLNGICLFIPKKRLKIAVGDSLVLSRQGEILAIQVKRTRETDGGVLIGGEIKSSNFNVMKFIVNNYVKQVKEILSQNA